MTRERCAPIVGGDSGCAPEPLSKGTARAARRGLAAVMTRMTPARTTLHSSRGPAAKMKRRALMLGLGAATLVGSRGAEAQTPAKEPRRVGVLSRVNPPAFDAVLAELRDLGYVEGRDIRFDLRSAEGYIDRLPALAEALVREGNVEAIIAESTPAAIAARRATTTIPIAAYIAVDPVAAGLATSLAHPGGNVTGIAFLAEERNAKRVELMHQISPPARRLAAITGTASTPTSSPGNLQAIQAAGRKLSIAVEIITIDDLAKLGETLSPAALAGFDGFILVPDIELTSRRAEIVALLAVSRKPAVYAWREAVQAGGLLSLGPDSADSHRRLARQLDRILKGVKPSEIPFERPSKFDLVINLRAARALGIDLPADLLARADEVIE
jgi:putative ABC transport system substrate-binding protein